MLITIAHIGAGNRQAAAGKLNSANPRACFEALTRLYLERITAYHPCQSEAFPTEAALTAWIAKQHTRVPATMILLDSAGRQFTSTAFADWLGTRRDQGAQHLVFAIGPHDGWSSEALSGVRNGPGLILSFGPMTLPHEMARLVLSEQIYRAFTILSNHPYHSGH